MGQALCEVWFYHLERTSLDQALPELLEKTLAKGWKAQVRTAAEDRLDHLDGWLWSFRDDSFLPHGLAAEPLAERQPILLGTGEANLNGAQALFLLDGAEPGELAGFERCVVVFDGRDEAALAQARSQWSAARAKGHPVSYWRQQTKGWEKQA
jgi:DNA polymerase III subunit chi